MHFEFATANRIIFGNGSLKEAAPLAVHMGTRALVITGNTPDRAAGLIGQLQNHGIHVITYQVPSEPTTDIITRGAALARTEQCDFVVGIGGGSVIDAGKAISALITNHGDLFDYLEVIGRAQPITMPSAPYIAIPTTAGTGTEVTKNAVILSEKHGVKVSMRSPLMLPQLVVVDPELTWSMPQSVTASTGLDALTQLIEAFITLRANPLVDAICREGLFRAARSLLIAFEEGNNPSAREDMSLASLFSGIALANAGLGAVHGFAAPLGGRLKAPHGAICARLLPIVMDTNVNALRERNPQSPALSRYHEIARILTQNPRAQAHRGVAWIQELCQALNVPGLSAIGLMQDDIPGIVADAQRASSMKGNPIRLTEEELSDILKKSL